MKMYKTTYVDERGPTGRITWQRTQATAAAKRAELKALGTQVSEIKTEALDIPTDAEGLLDWLNENITGE